MAETLASRVAQEILSDWILSGALRPGEPLPPLRDLVVQYEASIATVGQAVAQLQVLGWVRKGRGRRAFLTDRAAAGDANRGAIGLAVPVETKAKIIMRLFEGAERACRLYGRHLMLASARANDCEAERETVERLRAAGCQAIVLFPAVRSEEELASDYLNTQCLDTPIVLVDIAWPAQRRSQVLFDNVAAGRDVTQALLAQGHERIGITTVDGGNLKLMWRSTMDRRQGYEAALRGAGLSPAESWYWRLNVAGSYIDDYLHLLDAWRETPHVYRPTALIALDDMQAGIIAAEARELGIEIPRDLTIAGFDNTADQPPFRPGYLTTEPDFIAAGEKAVELALQHLDRELVDPVTYLLPTPLIRHGERRAHRRPATTRT